MLIVLLWQDPKTTIHLTLFVTVECIHLFKLTIQLKQDGYNQVNEPIVTKIVLNVPVITSSEGGSSPAAASLIDFFKAL